MPVQVVKTKTDIACEALFQCLPASTREEIRRNLQKELGYRINVGYVDKIMGHVRKNVPTYQYTVAYVSSGAAGAHDKGRYFAMMVQKDGTFYMDPEHRRYFSGGMQTKLSMAGTILSCSAVMIDVMTQYERSAVQREFWEDHLETLNYAVRRVSRIVKALKLKNIA